MFHLNTRTVELPRSASSHFDIYPNCQMISFTSVSLDFFSVLLKLHTYLHQFHFINVTPSSSKPNVSPPGRCCWLAAAVNGPAATVLQRNSHFSPPRTCPLGNICHQVSTLLGIFNPVCPHNSCDAVSQYISSVGLQYALSTRSLFAASETAVARTHFI